MYALIRLISAYSGADILLGIFSTKEKANSVRNDYIAALQSGSREDPWREQAYKEDMLCEDDLILMDLSGMTDKNSKPTDTVFVVSAYSEGFGQIMREIKSIVQTRLEAVRAVKNHVDDGFVSYSLFQEAVVDKELSDSRESQEQLFC